MKAPCTGSVNSLRTSACGPPMPITSTPPRLGRLYDTCAPRAYRLPFRRNCLAVTRAAYTALRASCSQLTSRPSSSVPNGSLGRMPHSQRGGTENRIRGGWLQPRHLKTKVATSMAKVGYRIVDADSHVFEPAEVWDRYVESEYRALARTAFYFRTDEEGLSTAILNGRAARLPGSSRLNRWAIWRPGMTADEIGALDPSIYHPINPAASDAAAKLRDMDAMGIEKAIIFPTLFAEYFPVVDNPELARVLSRAYNDWLYDWCGEDRNRLYPIAVLPMQDVSYALAELRRAASRGFKGCFIRPAFIHESDFPTHLKYRPLWEELERNGLVACLHPSAGHTNPEWTSLGAFVERVAANLEIGHNVAEAVACDGDNAIALTALLFCGHLEDYPRLKVAF